MKIQGKRALITGGAGLIGSHIADQLIEQGVAEIVILDNFARGCMGNLKEASSSGKVTITHGDICDREAMARAMQGIDIVFHHAAIRITQCAEEPRLAMEVLAGGTFNVLEAAVAANVKKMVAASSASVYGMADEFPTTEQHHPYNNRTLYGAAKAFNEGLMRSFNEMYGMEYVALRYFNVYGARMDIYGAYTEVLIRWMERIAAGKPPLIFGDGTHTLDLIYVEDIARAGVLAMESEATDVALNIASGIETSLNELAATLLRVMGSSLYVEHGPERKVNDVSRRIADTRKAAETIGFRYSIGLEEGLRRMVEWWRAEPKIGTAKTHA